MNLLILILVLSLFDAQEVPRQKSRPFRNGNIIINNKSNEFIKVALELRVKTVFSSKDEPLGLVRGFKLGKPNR